MSNETTAYYRPTTMAELDEILAKIGGKVNFLAGGDYNFANLDQAATLVDLQGLGLDQIRSSGKGVEIGGLATLQQLGDAFRGWDGVQEALSMEAGLNVRNSLSLTNFLRLADGRSPLLCILLALAPTVEMLPSRKNLYLEKYLLYRHENKSEIVSKVTLTLPRNLAYEAVARAPKDRPIICIAAAVDDTGSLRIACGGLLDPPQVLSISGDPQGEFALVRQAYQQEGGDAWASAEYRQAMSQVLLSRLLQSLGLSV
jgi:CO/xanthine dehydrogenase FAD-binding subunit